MTRVLVTKNMRTSSGAGGAALSHGDTWTLNGSGFGSAPTASFLQPTIEATGVGSNIVLPAPFGVPDAPVPTFQGYDDATRGRAIRALYDSVTAFDVGILWDRGGNVSVNESLMFSWWILCQTLGQNAPAEENDNGGTSFTVGFEDWQWKQWRFRSNNSVSDNFTDGDLLVSHWDNSDGSYITGGPGEGGPNNSFHYINGADSQSFPDPPFVDGVSGRRAGGDDLPTIYRTHWFRCDVFFFSGSGATGAVRQRVWHDGSVQEWRHVANLQGVDWLGAARAFRYFVLQNFIGNVDTPGENFNGTWLALDDFYVQRGHLRRVELTNNASLASSTWREIQQHATWADGQVTGALNTGANRTGNLTLHLVETDIASGNETSLGSAAVTVQ